MTSIEQSSLMDAGVVRQSSPGRTHSGTVGHWKETGGGADAEAFLRCPGGSDAFLGGSLQTS